MGFDTTVYSRVADPTMAGGVQGVSVVGRAGSNVPGLY